MLMGDAEGRKKQESSNKQQSKATQHSTPKAVTFPKIITFYISYPSIVRSALHAEGHAELWQKLSHTASVVCEEGNQVTGETGRRRNIIVY